MAETKFAIRVALDGGGSVEDGLRRIADAASNMAGKANQAGATAGGAFAGAGQKIQQAGYQVGDFAVQVASGQSALVAFTQQGAQLAGMFGPGGAIAGAALAIGAIALQFVLGKSAADQFADALKGATEIYRAANDGAERYRTGLAAEGDQIRQLTTYYGQLSEARRGSERIRLEAAQRTLTTQADTLRQSLGGSLRTRLAYQDDPASQLSPEEQMMSGIGGRSGAGELPNGLRQAVAALREFDAAGEISRESVAGLVTRLDDAARANVRYSAEIARARDKVLEAVPQVEALEDAQRRLAGQSEALRGNAAGAADALGGLGAAARAQEGAFDVLNRGLANATSLLTAFRSGGTAALRDARQAIAIETQARQSRETQIGELMQRNGLSRQDAETRARADDPERYRVLRETAGAGDALAGEQAVGDSRERLAEAKRLAGAGERGRPVEQARINAEREAREKNLEGLAREELIRNRVNAAQITQAASGNKTLESTRAQTEAAVRAAEAAEQGRAAFLRSAAAIDAAGQAARGAVGSERALAEATLNRSAAKEATKGAEAVLNMREQLAAARELAAAETPRQAQQAQLNEAIRQATGNMRAYAEATTDPRIREALTKEADAIERMKRDAKELEETTRNRAALFSQGQTLDRQALERQTVGMDPTARARILGEASERQKIEATGDSADTAEARERIRNAGDIGAGDEQLRKLKELEGAGRDVGTALADAFKGAALEGKSLGDVAKTLEKTLLDIAFKAMVQKPLENLFGGLMGSAMGAMGGGAGGAGGAVGSGVSSFLGSLFAKDGGMKMAVAHSGGIAGPGLVTRTSSAELFGGAPRYHGGGIAGLGPDEVPAILRTGERIRTVAQEAAVQRQLAARGGGAAPITMHVYARDADSFRASQGQILGAAARGIRRAQRNV